MGTFTEADAKRILKANAKAHAKKPVKGFRPKPPRKISERDREMDIAGRADHFSNNFWHVHIPRWHPTRLNTLLSAHWGRAAKLKRADKEMIAYYLKSVPRAQGKRLVEVWIGLGDRQRGGDVDAYQKSLLDALVENKIIVDDSHAWVEFSPLKYFRTVDGVRFTVIRISNIRGHV